jgi:hypothetical protein
MAIKGKGRTKGKSVSRAPRRDPVPVPVPFVQRRWVQVTAAFILGLCVFLFGMWIINGLRNSRDSDRAATQQAQQREALQSWQAEVEAQIGKVGTIQQGQAPTVSPQIASAVKDLKDGGETSVTADDLASTADSLATVADKLERFELATQIRDKGFGDRAEWITTTQLQYVQALRAYRTAALLAKAAIATDDEQLRKELASRAQDSLATADALLQDADRALRLALSTVGVVSGPTIPQQPTSPLQP